MAFNDGAFQSGTQGPAGAAGTIDNTTLSVLDGLLSANGSNVAVATAAQAAAQPMTDPAGVYAATDLGGQLQEVKVLADGKANKTLPSLTVPTLLNSWVVYAALSPTFGYYKDDHGIVRIVGAVSDGTGTDVMFVLPVGFRPLHRVDFVSVAGTATGGIIIDTSGNVYRAFGAGAWISLEGISFRTDI